MIFLQTGQEINLFDTLLDIGRIVVPLGVIAAFVWLFWKSRPKQ